MKGSLFRDKNKKLTLLLCALLGGVSAISVGISVYCLVNKHSTYDINSIEFIQNNMVVSSYQTEVFGDDTTFFVKVNDKEVNPKSENLNIKWEFVGKDLNCSLDNGVFKSGDTIGDVKIKVTVESKNTMSKILPISVVQKKNSTITTMSARLNEGYSNNYIEGECFNKNSIRVYGNFGEYNAYIEKYDIIEECLTPLDSSIHISYSDAVATFPISVSNKSLQEIEFATYANKTIYYEGQTFNKNGIKLKLNYEYITEESEEFYVDESTPLVLGQENIEVYYIDGEEIYTLLQPIEVKQRKLIYLTIDTQKAKTEYTVGEKFNSNGLKVLAYFDELGGYEIENYVFNQNDLTKEDQRFAISYTENEITKTEYIDILVFEPYELIRTVKIKSPYDIKLIWTYSYKDVDGQQKNDYLAFEENELIYDEENGIYEIPVGAQVTIEALNPIIKDLTFDGVEQNLSYPNIISKFNVLNGDTLNIDQIELAGKKIVISFAGNGNKQFFIYTGEDGTKLSNVDYQKVLLMFADNDKYYYSYKIDDTEYTASELKDILFTETTRVTVIKKEAITNNIKLVLNIGNDVELDVTIDKTTASLSDLINPTKAGYVFEGWSLSSNGVKINNTDYTNYLKSDGEHKIYALWSLEIIDYTGEEIIGTWSFNETIESNEYSSMITFNTNSTFTYSVSINGILNNSYTGIYRITEGEISIISFESNEEYNYATNDCFEFTITAGKLSSNLLVVEDESIGMAKVEYTKE